MLDRTGADTACEFSGEPRKDCHSFAQCIQVVDASGERLPVAFVPAAPDASEKCSGLREELAGQQEQPSNDKPSVCQHVDGFREELSFSGKLYEVCDICGLRVFVQESREADGVANCSPRKSLTEAVSPKQRFPACAHDDGFREFVDETGVRYQICDVCGFQRRADETKNCQHGPEEQSTQASEGCSVNTMQVQILEAFNMLDLDDDGHVDWARFVDLFEQLRLPLDEGDVGRLSRICPTAKEGYVDVKRFVHWLYAGVNGIP